MSQKPSSIRARIVCFGELLLRLASAPPTLLLQDMQLQASICGAEANVAVALAGFGHECRLVTAVPDNPLGVAALREVQSFGVAVDAPRLADTRMGLLFLQPGAMSRPSAITYDRAGSAFATMDPAAVDWPAILAGVDWLFLSGITAALGERPLASMRAAIAAARDTGVRIAFDTNYRPALWRGREREATTILRDLCVEADLLFADQRAIAMMVGGDLGHCDPDPGFQAAARRMFDAAPRLSAVAATRRTLHATNRQDLAGLLADRDGCTTTSAIALDDIVDRVGTGDAFAAGIVHGFANDWPRERTLNFAVASAQWAHSVPGDFLRASLGDIENMSLGHIDIQR